MAALHPGQITQAKRTASNGRAATTAIAILSALLLAICFTQAGGAEKALADEPLAASSVKASSSDTIDVNLEVTYGQTEARSMLAMMNEFRAGSDAWAWNSSDTEKVYYTGLSNLQYDYELERVAMQRAAEIAIHYAHLRPDGVTKSYNMLTAYSAWAENIAAGYSTASSVFTAWQEADDPYSGQGHRRNMLTSSCTDVGIGHVICGGTHYWVQVFSTPGLDSTATTANDSSGTALVSIAKSLITTSNAEGSPSNITMTFGDSVELPSVSASIQTTGTWPERPRAVSVSTPTWSVSSSSVAAVEGDMLVSKSAGSTTLSTTVSLVNDILVEVPVTVQRRSIESATVVFSQSEYTYDGSAKKPSVTVSVGSKELTTSDYEASYQNNTNAGTAKVVITGQGNYTGQAEAMFTISPKSAVVTSNDATKTYGEADPELTASVEGLIGSDKVAYSLTRASGENTGTYTIAPSGESRQGNYAVEYRASGKLTIEKAGSSISIDDQSAPFTGVAFAGTIAVTKSGSTGAVSFSYYKDASCQNAVSPADMIAVGAYYVKAELAGDANHEGATSNVATLTISPRPVQVTITGNSLSSTYDGTLQAVEGYTVKTNDEIYDILNVVGPAQTADVACAKGTNAGSYSMGISTGDFSNSDPNFDVTFKIVPGVLTIDKAESSISLNAQTKTYNGKTLSYDEKVSSSGSSGEVTYAYYSDTACKKVVSTTGVKDAGTYYVKATVTADDNYKAATSAAVKFVVNKASGAIEIKLVKATQTTKKTKNTKIKVAKAFKVTKNTSKGAVTYKKATGDKKITIAKNGDITVKKGLKKKTYKVTVNATAAATTNYKAATSTAVTLKIRVK